jgi:hypothetical protein
MDREEKIRLIAYRIWEEEGCQHGRDCEHWQRAELIWETQNQPQKSSTAKKAAKKKASKSK